MTVRRFTLHKNVIQSEMCVVEVVRNSDGTLVDRENHLNFISFQLLINFVNLPRTHNENIVEGQT
jgi:hypothetical protein